MKKSRLISIVLALAVALTSLGTFAACDPGKGKDDGKHSVAFSYNYVGAPAAVFATVDDGEKVAKPADPTRTDYVFTGWYTQAVCTEKYEYSFDTPVSGDLRLFAGWTLSRATVTFNPNFKGGESVKSGVDVGDTVERPETDPVREDYRFLGWFSDRNGTREFDFSSPVKGNTTLYAKWQQLVATVTFVETDAKSTVTKVTLDGVEHPKVSRPATDPVREDHRFNGWFSDRATTTPFDFDADVSGDTNVYAGWVLVRATVTLDMNYEGGKADAVKTDVGTVLTKPTDPTREGYDFGGWFVDPSCNVAYDFASSVNDNMTLFAKWNVQEYTMKFDANGGSGAPSSVKVNYGELLVEPETEPTRSGYEFTGWYTDAAATVLFDFTKPVRAEATLYAGWMSSSQSGETKITYELNYEGGGVYKTDSVKQNRKITEPDDPKRAGYYFAGWATDAAGTNMFNFNNGRAQGSSMTFYAKWLKGYTFEAEYTYLTGKPGQGSSDNCSGVDLIQRVKDVPGNGAQMGMSGGAYVGKLYYNGAFLEFNVTSDKEVDDATLVLRLAPDLFDMLFYEEDDAWQIFVNGEKISYGDLLLTGAIKQNDVNENGENISGDMYKRAFMNYVMNTKVHLKEGNNIIRLVTHNVRDHSGTFNAETPLIDCMYIYSNSSLKWTDGKVYPENMVAEGLTLADIKYDVTYDTERDKTK